MSQLHDITWKFWPRKWHLWLQLIFILWELRVSCLGVRNCGYSPLAATSGAVGVRLCRLVVGITTVMYVTSFAHSHPLSSHRAKKRTVLHQWVLFNHSLLVIHPMCSPAISASKWIMEEWQIGETYWENRMKVWLRQYYMVFNATLLDG